jgi:DME family drug/metabolite transporter
MVLVAAACYATAGVARELGPEESTVPTLAALRSLLGAALLAAVALAARRTGNRGAPLRSVPHGAWALAALGMALFAVAYFTGMRLTGIATGTVVALASAPLITGALEAVLWRRVPSGRWLAATVAAIVGISMLVFAGGGVDAEPLGVAAAVAAGLGYATFAMAARRIMDRGVRADAAMSVVFGLAGVILLPGMAADDPSWVATPGGAALVAWLGAVTVALAYWLYSTGLRSIAPSDATMLTLAEPVLATVFALILLDQRPRAAGWFGIAVVIGALVLASRGGPRPSVAIVPLASRPDLWTQAAQWSVEQWRHEFPSDTIDTYLDQYRAAANGAGGVLEVWAALSPDGGLAGVATLVDDDELPDAIEPGPWLAAVYVEPTARGSGVGTALVTHVASRATVLGHRYLFLYTADRRDWYERRGWLALRESSVRGTAVTVMRLSDGPVSPRGTSGPRSRP